MEYCHWAHYLIVGWKDGRLRECKTSYEFLAESLFLAQAKDSIYLLYSSKQNKKAFFIAVLPQF